MGKEDPMVLSYELVSLAACSLWIFREHDIRQIMFDPCV